MSVYYPQSALEGFGAALAHKLGVTVAFTTGKPRTDGKTIYLPRIAGAITKEKFRALCGTCVHEAAHVYFDSVRQVYSPYSTDALRASCMNAVLDVADETRIENVVAGARDMLTASCMSAADDIAVMDSLKNGDPVWAVLASGILMVRGGWSHDKLRRQIDDHKHYDMMRRAYEILKRCRTPHKKNLSKGYHKRSRASVSTLNARADELVALLQTLPPPPDKPEGQFGPAGADAEIHPEDEWIVVAGDEAATFNDGFDEANGVARTRTTYQSGRRQNSSDHDPVDYSRAVYGAVKPALAGPVNRMKECDDADGLDDGYASGPRLGRNLARVATDGRVFARRGADGENLHARVLLDVSWSVYHDAAKIMAVAQAFADALNPACESLELATFAEECSPVKDYKRVELFPPYTNTSLGIAWAVRRLAGSRGRRVVVVITDGQPGDREACRKQCVLARSVGVHIIGVAYGCSVVPMMATMPGALVVGADSPVTLACQLARVVKQLR